MTISIQSHAINKATNFSFMARRVSSQGQLLDLMVHTMAECFDTRPEAVRSSRPGNRATYYNLDKGMLTAQFANVPELVGQSHIKGTAPEGPLATVMENEGFVYVPDILSKQHYYLLDRNGKFGKITQNPLDENVTRNYIADFGGKFQESGESMSMVFGCLSVPGRIMGAFKIDAFNRGFSVLPAGVSPSDMLSIVANVSHIAAGSLDELYINEQVRSILWGAGHAFSGRLSVPVGYLEMIAKGELPASYAITIAERLMKTADYVREYLYPVKNGVFEIELKMSETDLAEILRSETGREDLIEIEEGFPTIMADPEKIRDMIVELLANARKYSPSDPGIIVHCNRCDDGIKVSITDKGLGMTKEQLEKIFVGGFRAHPEIKGTGFGLNANRKIIEKMGGKLWAESEGPGRGSTFCFTLPVK